MDKYLSLHFDLVWLHMSVDIEIEIEIKCRIYIVWQKDKKS